MEVEPGLSILSPSCAVLCLFYDLIAEVSYGNKNFTLQHHLSSFQVPHLVPDLLAPGALFRIGLSSTLGTLPYIGLW